MASSPSQSPVGPYPLIDLDTAIARLNDPSGFYMGGYGGGMGLDTAIATREVAPAAAGVDVAEADVASVPSATAPTAPPRPAAVAAAAGGRNRSTSQ